MNKLAFAVALGFSFVPLSANAAAVQPTFFSGAQGEVAGIIVLDACRSGTIDVVVSASGTHNISQPSTVNFGSVFFSIFDSCGGTPVLLEIGDASNIQFSAQGAVPGAPPKLITAAGGIPTTCYTGCSTDSDRLTFDMKLTAVGLVYQSKENTQTTNQLNGITITSDSHLVGNSVSATASLKVSTQNLGTVPISFIDHASMHDSKDHNLTITLTH
jgi:hypothetical protein